MKKKQCIDKRNEMFINNNSIGTQSLINTKLITESSSSSTTSIITTNNNNPDDTNTANANTNTNTNIHEKEYQNILKRKINVDTKNDQQKKLYKTSYWLCDAQPEYTNEYKEDVIRTNGPLLSTRPASPFSNQPLRFKDLIPITLKRDIDDDDGNNNDGSNGNEKKGTTVPPVGSKCICAVSNKVISTQSAIVIKKTGVVMLEDVYNKIVKNSKSTSSKSMRCPITNTKFKPKDVLKLAKYANSFSSSGTVVAMKYKPTLT